MFVYEFKTANACLITKIVISGSHLTLYFNKPNSQELNAMVRKLNLNSIVSGDHPDHVFCHDSHIKFSAMGDSLPHRHLKFPPNVDRLVYLEEIFKFLLNRQKNESLRKQDYDALVHGLDEERKSLGDTSFPSHVQNTIDNYDLKTPYIPEEEIDIVLSAFNDYGKNPYNMSLESIDAYAEELLVKNWGVLYVKMVLNDGDEPTENENILCDYHRSLLKVRWILLGINSNPSNIELYHAAIDTLKEITGNPNFPNKSEFSQNILYIKSHVTSKINSLESYQLLKGGVVSSLLLTGLFLLTENSPAKAIALGLIVPVISTLTLKYSMNPLRNAMKHIFFREGANLISNKNAVFSDPSAQLAENPVSSRVLSLPSK